MGNRSIVLLFWFSSTSLFWGACAVSPEVKIDSERSQNSSADLEQLIPITMANLRGHKSLYNEGWFVVSSTDKALKYAHNKSIESSGQAIKRLMQHTREHSVKIADSVVEGVKHTGQKTSSSFKRGSRNTKSILEVTHVIAKVEGEIGKQAAKSAWSRFITGYIDLVPRTTESIQKLKLLPENYWSEIRTDFSKLHSVSDTYLSVSGPSIQQAWSDGLIKAQHQFNLEYLASGQQNNSIAALGNLVKGYAKSSYYLFIDPSFTLVGRVGKYATKGVAYPVAASMIISGRTIQSLGRMLYYGGETGINIISPTVEGGLLAGLSVLSYGAVPVTYLTGSSIGVINQVVVSVKAPLEGAGSGMIHTGQRVFYHTALLSYDLLTSTTKVTINYISSGIALGYNALTALPTHVLLGTVNAAFFLAWDGPRLVVAKLKSTEGEQDIGHTPVGSVVDLQQLQQQPNIHYEIVTEDPKIINNILERIPNDLRGIDL